MRHWSGIAATAALVLVAGPACSQELEEPRWGLRGFGSLSATYHNAEDVGYRRNISQGSGAEAGRVDFGTDSRAGLQLDYRFSSEVQLVAQGMTRLNADDNWRPRLNRAFIRYTPDDSVRVRVGRIGYDIWLLAESPDVAYSYLPVRPATENFGVIPSDEFDGLDVTFTRPIDAGLLDARLFVGRTEASIARPDRLVTVDMDLLGAQLGFAGQRWHGRLGFGYLRFDAGPEYREIADILRMLGNEQTEPLIAALSGKRMRMPTVQLAFAYDGSPLTGQLVLSRTDGNTSLASNLDSVYFLGGYRYERWTPYVSFASVKSFANVLPTGLPDSHFGEINAVARLLQIAPQITQRTVAAGVRYDIAPRMDLKLQIDRVHFGESSSAFDYATPPRGSVDMTVLGVSFDFVF